MLRTTNARISDRTNRSRCRNSCIRGYSWTARPTGIRVLAPKPSTNGWGDTNTRMPAGPGGRTADENVAGSVGDRPEPRHSWTARPAQAFVYSRLFVDGPPRSYSWTARPQKNSPDCAASPGCGVSLARSSRGRGRPTPRGTRPRRCPRRQAVAAEGAACRCRRQ